MYFTPPLNYKEGRALRNSPVGYFSVGAGLQGRSRRKGLEDIKGRSYRRGLKDMNRRRRRRDLKLKRGKESCIPLLKNFKSP